ncbi:MAG: hypothetical protein ACTSU5_09335, partial [Promethearchaeota archaeon]
MAYSKKVIWKRRLSSTLVMEFLLSSAVFATIFANDTSNGTVFGDDKSGTLLGDVGEDGAGQPIKDAQSGEVVSWWNTSYMYRVKVNLQDTLGVSRYQPVQVDLTFGYGNCHLNSLRVVKYDGDDQWTQIPAQVWNTTQFGTDPYWNLASITFVADGTTVSGNTTYYVYYDPNDRVETYDYSSTQFSGVKNGDKVTIRNGDLYELEFEVGRGIYNFSYLDGANRVNVHTNMSASPGSDLVDDTLIGWWQFDGDATERTGHTPGYTIYGDVQFVPGKFGEAAYFDGSGDYIGVEATNDLYGGMGANGWTYMGWFKTSSTADMILTSWDRNDYWRLGIGSDSAAQGTLGF